jgi:hypothetical protein
VGANAAHSVCVCTIHQNFKLMMIGGKIAELMSEENVPLKTHKDCFSERILVPACCKDCAKADYMLILKERLRSPMDENMMDV